jgi:hypothetical protein
MIELNLLPKELRKKKKHLPEIPKIPMLPVAVCVVGILIAMHLSMILLVKNKRDLSVTLREKWDQMQPQREKTERITKEIDELQRRIAAIKKIAKPDLDWSQLLMGLNQAVIPNIWLSDFEVKFTEKGSKVRASGDVPVLLGITGYALGKSEEGTSLVAKFITSLKKNKDFSIYFGDIGLESMRNLKIADEEAMMFRLNCRFKTIETVPVEGKKAEGKKGESAQKTAQKGRRGR